MHYDYEKIQYRFCAKKTADLKTYDNFTLKINVKTMLKRDRHFFY